MSLVQLYCGAPSSWLQTKVRPRRQEVALPILATGLTMVDPRQAMTQPDGT